MSSRRECVGGFVVVESDDIDVNQRMSNCIFVQISAAAFVSFLVGVTPGRRREVQLAMTMAFDLPTRWQRRTEWPPLTRSRAVPETDAW